MLYGLPLWQGTCKIIYYNSHDLGVAMNILTERVIHAPFVFLLIFFCWLSYCTSPAFAVELLIYNDLKESESGATLFIENARSVETPASKMHFKIGPGDTKPITRGNVTSFVLVRAYPDHKLKYDVSCPAEAKGSFTITILEVHNNKLPAGCRLERAGHWSKHTGLTWDRL